MPSSLDEEEINIKTTISLFSLYFLGAVLLPTFPPLGMTIMIGGGIIAIGI